MKIISAGVLVYFNNHLLACVPFGKKNGYDIPKGHVEDNETFERAAIRELYEETGIKVLRGDMKELGQFKYTSSKDLFLFSYEFDFNPAKCKCISLFDFHGKAVPEVIGYKSIDFLEIDRYFYNSLKPVLNDIIERGRL